MKKIIIILSALLTFLFISCVREYECTCNGTHSSHGNFYIHDTKKNAKQKCEGDNKNRPDSTKCHLVGYK